MFSNRNVILLMVIFGFIQADFNTLGTVVGELAKEYGFTTDDASIFGAVFIVGGIIGSAAFGVWVECKKAYKLSIIIISVLSILSVVGLTFSLVL